MKRMTEPVTLTSASFPELVREELVRLGDDPEREGLQRTPERVEEALRYLTRGYEEDADKILTGALFTVSYDEMQIVKHVERFSLCEHQLLPFYRNVQVAY